MWSMKRAPEKFSTQRISGLSIPAEFDRSRVADESGGLYRINTDLQLTKVATVSGTRALGGQRQRLLAVTEHAISAVDSRNW